MFHGNMSMKKDFLLLEHVHISNTVEFIYFKTTHVETLPSSEGGVVCQSVCVMNNLFWAEAKSSQMKHTGLFWFLSHKSDKARAQRQGRINGSQPRGSQHSVGLIHLDEILARARPGTMC